MAAKLFTDLNAEDSDRTAWKTQHGDTPAEMTIGRVGKVSSGPFVPQVVSRKLWGRPDEGQAGSWFSINHIDTVVGRERPETVGGRVRLTVGNVRHEFYDLAGDRAEWNVVFASRPKSNVLRFSVKHSSDVVLYKQPALAQDEIEGGAYRPDNVVDSFAIYSNQQGDLRNSRGEPVETRRTGKIGHIYRVELVDAKGSRAWAESVDLTGGTMYVTLPGSWLDGATYPVTVDPTFGMDSIGASSGSLFGTRTYASSATLSENGTLSSLHAYASSTAASTNDWIRIGLYADDSGPSSLITGTDALLVINTSGAEEFSEAGLSEALTSGTYWIGICSSDAAGTGESGANLATAYYDTTTGTAWYNAMSDPPLQDPFDRDTSLTRSYSVWGTYVTGAGDGAGGLPIHLFFNRSI